MVNLVPALSHVECGKSDRLLGAGLVEFETGQSPEPYRSTLENCRKLSAINRLLKCSYMDNWVANHRLSTPEPKLETKRAF